MTAAAHGWILAAANPPTPMAVPPTDGNLERGCSDVRCPVHRDELCGGDTLHRDHAATRLAALQDALGEIVASPALCVRVITDGAAALARYPLDARSRAWLVRAARSRGLAFTRSIQQSWCALRVRSGARITVSALPPGLREDIVAAWVARGGGTASFYTTETLAFLDFVIAHLPAGSPLASIARMEQAAHRVSAARTASPPRARYDQLGPGTRVRRHPDASVVRFAAPPTAVLAAALAGAPLPTSGDEHALLFAPGLSTLFRTAHPDEVAVFDACATAVTPDQLGLHTPHVGDLLIELLGIGALIVDADLAPV